MGLRMLCDYCRVRRWEREVLRRGVHTDGAVARWLRSVPWSSITLFVFVMLFFGVDLGASMRRTTQQVRESKQSAEQTVEEVRRRSQRWSVEQVKQFRQGELPQTSWSEGVLCSLHHLRRVHELVPDARLGQVLKDKLLRLNLKPTLAEVSRWQHSHVDGNKDSGGDDSNNGGGGGGSSNSSDRSTTPSSRLGPMMLSRLLDDLAHFRLAGSNVARDALQLVPYYVVHMPPRMLAHTIAACCALGEQDATVPAAQLLRTALHGNNNNVHTTADKRHTAATTTRATRMSNSDGNSSSTPGGGGALQSGGEMVQLMEALQRAGVRHEDVWSLLAEHCVRCMDTFTARQLLRVLELFHAQRVTYCPDFFVAMERYLAAQVAVTAGTFITSEQLQEVIAYYKLLGQPVVSLLAVGAGRFADRFDTTLSAAASGSSSSSSRHDTTAMHAMSGSSSGGGNNAAAALQAFVQTARRAFAEADGDELRQLLHKCEGRGVMNDALMTAAVRRLCALYFTPMQPHHTEAGSSSSSGDDDDGVVLVCGDGATALRVHDVTRMTQTMVVMLRFGRPEYFAGSMTLSPSSSSAAASSAASAVGSSADASGNDVVRRQVTVSVAHVLLRMLDALAPHITQHYHVRYLNLVNGAAQLVASSLSPPLVAPVRFYRALVHHLQHCSDITESVAPQRLHIFVAAMCALRAYGGEAVLQQHMPVIAVEVTNVPRRVQAEVAGSVAAITASHRELLPTVFRAVTRERQWHETLTVGEVQHLLDAMQRSGRRDGAVLNGVVAFMTAHTARLRPDTLVRHLHTLALLGYRDIEFYIAAASDLLKRVPHGTVMVDRGGSSSNGSGGGGGSYHDDDKNSMASRRSLVTAAGTLTHSHHRCHGRRGGASALLSSSSSSSASSPHRWQQQQQQHDEQTQLCSTTAQDLCTLLYVFTFVLKDVIRVVQQTVARLKMCVAQTTPHDVTLVLYSMVKLHITHQRELTTALCARLAAALRTTSSNNNDDDDHHQHDKLSDGASASAPRDAVLRCRAEELTSAWGSLRALGFAHDELLSATAHVLHGEAMRRTQHSSSSSSSDSRDDTHTYAAAPSSSSSSHSLLTPLSDAQFVTVMGAVVHVTAHEHTARHVCTSTATSAALGGSAMGAPMLHASRQMWSASAATDANNDAAASLLSPLTQRVYKAAVVRMMTMLQRHLSSSAAHVEGKATAATTPQTSGLHVYLAVTTLPHLHAVRLTQDEWHTAASCANALHAQLTRGQGSNAVAGVTRDDGAATAAAEVLLALHHLRPDSVNNDSGGVRASLVSLVPQLAQFVYAHRSYLLAMPSMKEALQRTGLLDDLLLSRRFDGDDEAGVHMRSVLVADSRTRMADEESFLAAATATTATATAAAEVAAVMQHNNKMDNNTAASAGVVRNEVAVTTSRARRGVRRGRRAAATAASTPDVAATNSTNARLDRVYEL